MYQYILLPGFYTDDLRPNECMLLVFGYMEPYQSNV